MRACPHLTNWRSFQLHRQQQCSLCRAQQCLYRQLLLHLLLLLELQVCLLLAHHLLLLL